MSSVRRGAAIAAMGVLASLSSIIAACVGDASTTDSQSDSGASSDSAAPGADGGATQDAGTSGSSEGGATPADGGCVAGEKHCDGLALQNCNADGKAFVTIEQCQTAALCTKSPADHCLAPACSTDQVRCNVAALEKCAPGRDGYVLVSQCASVPLCSAQDGGSCTPPACAINDLMCMVCANMAANDCLMMCKADRTGFVLKQDCGLAQGKPNDESCNPVTLACQ